MRALLTSLLLAAAACGGGNHGGPGPDATPDAPPDAAPLPCDYTEASDGGNATTAETTNVVVGATARTLCGSVDPGHFDAASQTVDVDRLRVTVGGSGDTALLVQFFGDAGLAQLDEFSVLIFDAAANPTLINGGRFDATLGGHGVFRSSLAPGTYDIVVRARAGADVAASLPYKVRVLADTPCGTITAPASYVEAGDTASNLGNDVLDVDLAADPSVALTAAADTAEATQLTIDAATPVRVSGSSADVTGPDAYLDRDTFEIATGPSTEELSIRLDWLGAADLDYAVFEEGSVIPTGLSATAGTTGGEYATFAVRPGTSYWVWVGASKASTAVPMPYDLAICGATVLP